VHGWPYGLRCWSCGRLPPIMPPPIMPPPDIMSMHRCIIAEPPCGVDCCASRVWATMNPEAVTAASTAAEKSAGLNFMNDLLDSWHCKSSCATERTACAAAMTGHLTGVISAKTLWEGRYPALVPAAPAGKSIATRAAVTPHGQEEE
jgi:hypothetical protein